MEQYLKPFPRHQSSRRKNHPAGKSELTTTLLLVGHAAHFAERIVDNRDLFGSDSPHFNDMFQILARHDDYFGTTCNEHLYMTEKTYRHRERARGFFHEFVESIPHTKTLTPLFPSVVTNDPNDEFFSPNNRSQPAGKPGMHRVKREYKICPTRTPNHLERVQRVTHEFGKMADHAVGNYCNLVATPRKLLRKRFCVCCRPTDLGRIKRGCDENFHPVRDYSCL